MPNLYLFLRWIHNFKQDMFRSGSFYYLTILLLLISGSCGAMGNSPWDTEILINDSFQRGHIGDTIIQKNKNPELARFYTQSIRDFILLAKKEYKLTFGTLFFGKHVYGQADDFPDIELPNLIEQTHIVLISPEQGLEKQKQNPSSFYINLIAWMDRTSAEFNFVTFSNGMAHQFDCSINYKKDKNNLKIIRSGFKNYLYKAK